MKQELSPSLVVDRQMIAYNNRDLESYLALFASDAILLDLNDGTEMARGAEALRSHYAKRFLASPNLQYEIVSRIAVGKFVIDHERVSGIAEMPVEVIAVYDVADALIRSIGFLRPERGIDTRCVDGRTDAGARSVSGAGARYL